MQCLAPVATAATPTIIASPASVSPGGQETVAIRNGPGDPLDWLALYAVTDGFFVNNSSPAANTEFLNGQTGYNPPTGAATSELFEPVPPDASFLTATLNQIRTEQPTLLAPIPSGVTDVRFYRVLVDAAITGIHWEAASAGPPPPVNGARGSVNSVAASCAPSSGLCSAGTASRQLVTGPGAGAVWATISVRQHNVRLPVRSRMRARHAPDLAQTRRRGHGSLTVDFHLHEFLALHCSDRLLLGTFRRLGAVSRRRYPGNRPVGLDLGIATTNKPNRLSMSGSGTLAGATTRLMSVTTPLGS